MSAREPATGSERATRRRPHAGEAGFTLIELAVATAVLLLAVLLACDLLDESGRLLQHSVRRARDPYVLIAAELLRNDLRGARPPGLTDPLPVHLPLELRTSDGWVTWSRGDDGSLVRNAGGVEHAYIQDVSSFRWRPLGSAYEVWVEYRTSSPYLRQLQGSLPKSDPGETEELHLVLVARGGYADQW
ncbi:MAG TPA: prepilin-type N-terminal cleavage/methylation domain-containing protein [Thermoanaerobaculia bacterium]|nr:prepilin-type N-terminal cleavage/methylation domain-containing protein [Thermoanaerobaculia bacterium]